MNNSISKSGDSAIEGSIIPKFDLVKELESKKPQISSTLWIESGTTPYAITGRPIIPDSEIFGISTVVSLTSGTVVSGFWKPRGSDPERSDRIVDNFNQPKRMQGYDPSDNSVLFEEAVMIESDRISTRNSIRLQLDEVIWACEVGSVDELPKADRISRNKFIIDNIGFRFAEFILPKGVIIQAYFAVNPESGMMHSLFTNAKQYLVSEESKTLILDDIKSYYKNVGEGISKDILSDGENQMTPEELFSHHAAVEEIRVSVTDAGPFRGSVNGTVQAEFTGNTRHNLIHPDFFYRGKKDTEIKEALMERFYQEKPSFIINEAHIIRPPQYLSDEVIKKTIKKR